MLWVEAEHRAAAPVTRKGVTDDWPKPLLVLSFEETHVRDFKFRLPVEKGQHKKLEKGKLL
jgi:hypothetical protein